MKTFVSRDGRGAAAMDLEHLPLVLTTWWGSSDEGVVDGVFDGLEGAMREAARDGLRIVSISWIAQPGMPSALTRRRMADRTRQLEKTLSHVSLATIVVLESRISRAGLKAVQWMLGEDEHMTVVGSLEEAVDRAVEVFDAAGRPLENPLDPATYRPPNPLANVS